MKEYTSLYIYIIDILICRSHRLWAQIDSFLIINSLPPLKSFPLRSMNLGSRPTLSVIGQHLVNIFGWHSRLLHNTINRSVNQPLSPNLIWSTTVNIDQQWSTSANNGQHRSTKANIGQHRSITIRISDNGIDSVVNLDTPYYRVYMSEFWFLWLFILQNGGVCYSEHSLYK